MVTRIEDVVLHEPEVKSIESLIGGSNNLETGASNAPATHIAQVFVELRR